MPGRTGSYHCCVKPEKNDTIINYVAKERLDQLSETGAHQGVIAQVAAYEYASVDDILAKAQEKGEASVYLYSG